MSAPKARNRGGARSASRTAPGVDAALARLGKRVRVAREAAGFTQEGAAHEAGLTTKYVFMIERGQTNPSVASLLGLARAFGVKVAEFFEGV